MRGILRASLWRCDTAGSTAVACASVACAVWPRDLKRSEADGWDEHFFFQFPYVVNKNVYEGYFSSLIAFSFPPNKIIM